MKAPVLERIAEKASAVRGKYDEHQAASDAEIGEAAALLEEVREVVRPALRALASRLPGSHTVVCRSEAEADSVRTESPRNERGCILINNLGRDSTEDARHGSYFGDSLVLLDDGQFARLERSGAWSTIPGERSSWTTTLRTLDASEVARVYGAEQTLAGLEAALDAQLKGASGRRATEARDRAEKLRALRTLIETDRTILPGLRVSMASKLWRVAERAGFAAGDARTDPNDAAANLKRKVEDREVAGRVVWRRRGPDEVAVVGMDDGQVVAIGDLHGPWGVVIGLLDELGRFQSLTAGGRSGRR